MNPISYGTYFPPCGNILPARYYLLCSNASLARSAIDAGCCPSENLDTENFANVVKACWMRPLRIEALVIGPLSLPPTCKIEACGPAIGSGSFKPFTERAPGDKIVK